MNAMMTVTELNEYSRLLLASDPILKDVTVTGEISGCTRAYSGHLYFSLKDEGAKIDCAMWRSNAAELTFQPQNGMQVRAHGSVSIYSVSGKYQLYVDEMTKSGVGDRFVQFEQLKTKLQAEGLFDPARKREIPYLPRKIGLVTAETGAAVRDMIRVARERDPKIDIVVSPCLVQGDAAPQDIARAIRLINERTDCDVLLVGRGGGSMEDLWAFNEEVTARAIAGSRIPVISCVGHEVDFSIADFVADVRAATPTHAAQLAVPVIADERANLNALVRRLSTALTHGQESRRARLDRIRLCGVMRDPADALLREPKERLADLTRRADTAQARALEKARNRLSSAALLLRSLDPGNVVSRGYAVVRDQNGRVVTSAAKMPGGARFVLDMKDGKRAVTACDE